MSNFLKGLQARIGRQPYEKQDIPASSLSGFTEREKLQKIALGLVTGDRDERIRRAQTNYLMALYYQGYQSVDVDPSTHAFDIYERDDYFVENQFRQHVITNVMALNKSEGEITTRPSSDQPQDIAASRVAENALPVIHENIQYKRLKTTKNLYKCLFGEAFIYTDYTVDRKFGVIAEPQYKYVDKEVPASLNCPACGRSEPVPEDPLAGSLVCPECQTPMEFQEASVMPSKVADGFRERAKGQEIALVCSPLEIDAGPSNVKSFTDCSYLRWKAVMDRDLADFMYPGLAGGGTGTENDLAAEYLEILGNLSGNLFGDSRTYARTGGRGQVQMDRVWLQPETFMGDRALENKYKDGVRVVLVNGKVVEVEAEDFTTRWTHHLYLPNAHSWHGDGMYDALLMQDIINELNSLILQHVRYTTVGLMFYDANMLDLQKISNNPAHARIPVNTTVDKKVSDAFANAGPGQLSGDVGAFLGMKMQALQDMTGAVNPLMGKSTGANTPYSQSVFQAENAISRHLPSNEYNQPAVIECNRQLLQIAQDNWVDLRHRKLIDNTGKWSFMQFMGADLRQGSFDVIMSNTDFKPMTRAEQIQGLEFLTQLSPILPAMPPKQKLRIEEILGLPPDANPMSTQISRASRTIDRLRKGEVVTPLQFVDDPIAQAPVFQEFLAGQDGEALAEEEPQVFASIYTYLASLLQLGMMQMAMGGGMPGAAAPQQAPPGPTTAQPSKPPEVQKAQAPVPEEMKQPMPALPANPSRGV